MNEVKDRADFKRIIIRLTPEPGIAVFYNEYRKRFVSLRHGSKKCEIRFKVKPEEYIGTYSPGITKEELEEDFLFHLKDQGIVL